MRDSVGPARRRAQPAPFILFRLLLVLLPLVRAGGQVFQDVSAASGLALAPNAIEPGGRGPCFGDFDRDGDQDVVFPSGPGMAVRYFSNLGTGTFTDQSAASGLGLCQRGHACIAGDVDNDGDLDIYLVNSWSPNRLYLNSGNATFVEAGAAAGVAHPGGGYTASFGDYDLDGWLDIYLGNHQNLAGQGEANVLYHNNGNGTFTDVTTIAGVGNTGLAFAGFWHDYDDDGWPDIFVGNDKGFVPGLPPDTTYRNNGNGTFTDVGAAINTNFGIGAMGGDFTDAFNDGGWDIAVSNAAPMVHVVHVWSPAAGTYQNQATTLGILTPADGWAIHWFDYDNDGRDDLYVVHDGWFDHLYRNTGSGPWPEVGVATGAAVLGPKKAAAVADFDNDGRLDILLPRDYLGSVFLRNTIANGNHWLRVSTEGTRSNRDGIGAKVLVTAQGITRRQTVRTGIGFLGGSDLRLHFGLGSATVADRVEIRWPSGQVQVFLSVPADQELHAIEPRLRLQGPVSAGGPPAGLILSVPEDGGLPSAMALTLATSPGIPLGNGLTIPVQWDALFVLTLTPQNRVLPLPLNLLSAAGTTQSPLAVPWFPGVSGLTVHAAAVTGHPAWFAGIKTILRPLAITIP